MLNKKFPLSQKLLLLLGDIGLVMLAVVLAVSIINREEPFRVQLVAYSGMIPLMIVVLGILFNINGLYSIGNKRFAEILLSIFVSLFNLFIMVMAISFFVQEFSYSRSVLVLSISILFIGISIWRHIMWRLERSLHPVRKVLLVGNEQECTRVYNRMKMLPHLDLELKYVCTDIYNSSWQIGVREVDLIIVCSDMRLKEKAEIVHYCNMKEKQVLLIPAVYEIFCNKAELDKIDDIPVFRPQSLKPSLEQRTLKRALDIVVSSFALIIALPFMMITMMAIKIVDPGSIFYSQIRTGRNEKEFKVYKFRTMRVDAEKHSGPVFAIENDPRITKLGRFLRATRLDELPQIWNVVVGDMSLVGPRPERPFFVKQFKKEIPEYIYRHNVKPGITGMAQVYGKYNTTPYDKLVYDLMYIQNCNIIQDLVIIVQTIRVLFTKSATEGVLNSKKKIDLKEFEIHNVYGDF